MAGREKQIWWLCVGLLVLVSLATRLPAPWKLDVINDEMHHLQSWRNRYGTDDIYPLFLQRLEASGRLSPQRLEQVKKVYHLHPLVQRGLIVLVDPQPPLYPTLAEITQALTDSSLVLLRGWSVLLSLAAIYVAYRLGRDLRDPWTGLWLAILVCIGATTQFYAGIGRPYAMTQLAILLALWTYVRRNKGQVSLRLFLGTCLLAQAVQWMAWAVVGPLVALELLRSWQRDGRPALRPLCWYVPASLLLLAYMAVQLQNPTISDQGGGRSLAYAWWCYAVAGPFSHLGSFGDTALHAGAAVFCLASLAGAMVLLRRETDRFLAAGLLLAPLCGLAAAILIGTEVRFTVSYLTPALVLAAAALSAAGAATRLPWALPAAALCLFAWLSLWHPEDPYERIDPYDVPWSEVAATVKAELKPGETWIAFPPNIANNLYRYGPLPEPVIAVGLHDPAMAKADVLLMEQGARARRGDLAAASELRRFGQFVLVRSPATKQPGDTAAEAGARPLP